MARMQIKGLDEYLSAISELGNKTEKLTSEAIYNGANIMADEVRNKIEGLSTVNENYNRAAYRKGYRGKLSEEQKKGLLDSLGIAKLEQSPAYKNVRIGFDGYNNVKTKKYSNGQPNQLIARVVESGTSYTKKQPFFRPAVNAKKKTVEDKMAETFEKGIDKIMKE